MSLKDTFVQTLASVKILRAKHIQPDDYYRAILAGRDYAANIPIVEDVDGGLHCFSLDLDQSSRRPGKFRLAQSFQWGCISFLYKDGR